jgi:ubiquinone/menaquinone biosynthesis C-methylase UbiE
VQRALRFGQNEAVRIRRVLGFAGLGAAGLWVASPMLRAARQSLRTSSAPGVGAYELMAGLTLSGHYRDVARDCAAVLSGVASPAILEIGPGPGHLAEQLLPLLPDTTWTGLDVDPAMLAAAGRRLERSGLRERATLIEGDVARMPFGDASFDLVVSSLSAHHWPDPERGFAEIRRVLRPGGRALVYDLHPHATHLQGAHAGLAVAGQAFDVVERRRHRGFGPVTIIVRADLRA